MTKDEALKLALEALESALSDDKPYIVKSKEAITAIKEALAQPEQEPVAWWDGKESVVFAHDEIYTPDWTDYWTKPLYTIPPQRKPLTDEEIVLIVADCAASHQHTDIHFARAIEAKLKEKNT